jgi:hypothetical protein
MAEHGKAEYATATGNDYAEHEQTYDGMIRLTKVGTLGVLLVVVALAIFGTVGSLFWTFIALILSGVTTAYGLLSRSGSATPAAAAFVFMLIVWALLV